jgi:hypothetical protein
MNQEVCRIAETLLLKGNFLEYKKTTFTITELDGVKIDLGNGLECDRTIVHRVIESEVIDIIVEEDSTIYVVEIIADVGYISFVDRDGTMIENGGSEGITKINGDPIDNTNRRNFTFFIEHNLAGIFTLTNVDF